MAIGILAVGGFIGGLISSYGSMQEGYAAADAAEGQARNADIDAGIAYRNANQVLSRAESDVRTLRVMQRKQIGSMRAAVGGSGLTQEGSVQDLLQETVSYFEQDAQNIMAQGRFEAGSYRLSAERQKAYSAQLRSAAKGYRAGGELAGLGKLLGAGANFLDKLPDDTGPSTKLRLGKGRLTDGPSATTMRNSMTRVA